MLKIRSHLLFIGLFGHMQPSIGVLRKLFQASMHMSLKLRFVFLLAQGKGAKKSNFPFPYFVSSIIYLEFSDHFSPGKTKPIRFNKNKTEGGGEKRESERGDVNWILRQADLMRKIKSKVVNKIQWKCSVKRGQN